LKRVAGNSSSGKRSTSADGAGRAKILVIAAALLALFLGALDALVVGAAMPTIVADLGGLDLYSWVFSSYLLARAIALPIFGKLCDLYNSKRLYCFAIAVFVISSLFGGIARNMTQLIVCRALQGIGAGGTFALAYIVVADIAAPEKRGKMMGLISFVWGVASILGPALGGFIVDCVSWRWIFYLNLPLGCAALLAILLYLEDVREKRRHASLDLLGAITLSIAVLALLAVFLVGGRTYPWVSLEIIGLGLLALGGGIGFCFAENRAKEPILALGFFRNLEFSFANSSAFFSSSAIFSLSAYSPLFIQEVLGKTPAELGMAMVPLSLGWSAGALICGQLITREREKPYSILGSLLLIVSAGLTVTASPATPLVVFSLVLAVGGVGMGFVSVATLLIVQNSLDAANLGVATSSQQFARTLGGTIGIGISGSLVSAYLANSIALVLSSADHGEISTSVAQHLLLNLDSVFQPDIQAALSPTIQKHLHEAVEKGVGLIFWSVLAASLVSLLCCILIPGRKQSPKQPVTVNQ
jgi:EmrB/QacA subfamily drug resistance transporter